MAFDEYSAKRRMTPEDVLEVFIDQQRSCWGDEPDEIIHFDMTIAEWQDQLGLVNDVAWNERKFVWKSVTSFFRVSIPYKRWKSAVRPERTHRLRELCELIASEAVVEEIRPITVFGRACRPAGVFLAIRNALRDAGIDTTNLRPSTSLRPTLKRYRWSFQQEMAKLAPGKLPLVKVREHALVRASNILIALGLLSLIGALLAAVLLRVLAWAQVPFGDFALAVTLVAALAGPAMALAGAIGAYATNSLLPSDAELGHLETFRDLCYAVGEEARDPSKQPT